MFDKGKIIPVNIAQNFKSIKIGDYKIASPHYINMVHYTINRGFIGWLNDKKPEFAKLAKEAIKKSRNPLYLQN